MSNKEQGDNRDDCLWGLCNRDESRPAASAITDSVTVAVGAVGYGTTTAAAYLMDGTKTVAGAVRDGTVSAAGLLRDGTAAAIDAMRDQPTAAVVGTAVAVGTTTMVAAPLVLATAGFSSGGVAAGSAAAAWQVELQTNHRNDFTITEKAPTWALCLLALLHLRHYSDNY